MRIPIGEPSVSPWICASAVLEATLDQTLHVLLLATQRHYKLCSELMQSEDAVWFVL